MPKTHYKVDPSAVREGERRDRDAERETAERHGFYQYQRFVLVPVDQIAHQPVWNPGRIESILDAIDRGTPLPPIRADKDRGKYDITDGIHRYNASLQRGYTHIPVLETVTVDAPEMYVPPMLEKPVLRPGTYVKLTEKPYRATSLWARVVEYLGPYRGRGDVTRHVYALDGIVRGRVDFVGDWHDDKFDVGRPPRDVLQAFEAEDAMMGKKARGIEVNINDRKYKNKVLSAFQMLPSKDKAFVTKYVDSVEFAYKADGGRSGYNARSKTISLAAPTLKASRQWLASVLVHEAVHGEQGSSYHDNATKSEQEAIARQLQTLIEVGGKEHEIAHLQSQMGDHWKDVFSGKQRWASNITFTGPHDSIKAGLETSGKDAVYFRAEIPNPDYDPEEYYVIRGVKKWWEKPTKSVAYLTIDLDQKGESYRAGTAWTDDKHRRQGLIRRLYDMAWDYARSKGKGFRSGWVQSPHMARYWESMVSKGQAEPYTDEWTRSNITDKGWRRIKSASTYPVTSVATAIFNESGQVLILRRGSTAPWMPGKWSLPGGVVDPGEGLRQAAIREAIEETTLRVRSASSLAVLDHAPEGWAAAFFVSGPGEWSGEVKLDYENDAYAWISASEIGGYSFIPTVKEALMKAFQSSSASRVASRYNAKRAGLLKAPPAMVKEITEWVQTNVGRVLDSGNMPSANHSKVFPVDLKGWPYLRSFSKSLGKEIAETESRLKREEGFHRARVDAAKVISRMDQNLIQEGGDEAVQAVMEAHPDLDKSAVWYLVHSYDPAKFDVPERSIMVPDFLRTLFDIPQKEGGKFTKRTVPEIRALLKKVGSMPPLKIAEAVLSERGDRRSPLRQRLNEITVEIMWKYKDSSGGASGRWSPTKHKLQVFPMNMRAPHNRREVFMQIPVTVEHELQHMTQSIIAVLADLSEAGGLPSRNIRRTRAPAESGAQMLSKREEYYLLDSEFYTWVTTSARNFLNDMAENERLLGEAYSTREWDSARRSKIVERGGFFHTLKKHEPAKWRKAVGEFWKATEQPVARVASRHIEARSRCRGCGGPIRHAPHHPAMEGYCGYCAFDEFDM